MNTTPDVSAEVGALEQYMKESDGITVGIPIELAHALNNALQNAATVEPMALETQHGGIAHTKAGFVGGFMSEHGRKPTEQEIWNHAIRSWRDLNPPVPATVEPVGTPSSQWHAQGRSDPHGHTDTYNGERSRLTLGKLTDDELANGAFMNYDQVLTPMQICNPKPGQHMPIIWMTAVKERIRWLSRSLEKALAASAPTTRTAREARRQTGRTTRMLKEARKLAAAGRAVYILECSQQQAQSREKQNPELVALGVKFESPSTVRFDTVRQKLVGAHPNCELLIDHYLAEIEIEALEERLRVWRGIAERWDVEVPLTRFSFDDMNIGVARADNKCLVSRLVPRPGGMTNDQWYKYARLIIDLLNVNAEKKEPS